MKKTAVISSCGTYRYLLTRQWDALLQWVVFVMLNPSTADDKIDDRTIRRCIGFAKREGAGGLIVVNLFAFRATKSKELFRATDPIGPQNDVTITGVIRGAKKVIVAWGAHPMAKRGTASILKLCDGRKLWCLGRTKTGEPKHPLYIRADQPLEEFRPFVPIKKS